MEQNINLITTLNIQPLSFFDAKLISQIIGGWFLLLVLIYTVAFSLNSPKQKTIANLESTKKTLQTQIGNLNTELSSFDTTDRIKSLKDLPFSSTNSIGFYGYLADLAKFTPNGIWLKDITFSQPDGLILLKGSTSAAAEIPLFIESLEASNNLKDKNLGTLQIQKAPNTNNIDFILGTVTTTATEPSKT